MGTGRSTLGAVETEEFDAAIGNAIRRGVERIVLFGWSMGAAIALQIAHRSDYAPLVAGFVLDSPVLNWVEVIEANCKRAGILRDAGALGTRLACLKRLPARVSLRDFDWVARVGELAVPTLIVHGSRDDSVATSVPSALSERRVVLVRLEIFVVGHTLSWNFDAECWRTLVVA